MTLDDIFGDVRATLSRSPGERTFGTLCRLVERAARRDEDATRAELLPYLQRQLADWPDAARRIPRRGLHALWRDDEPELPVWLELGRRLVLSHDHTSIEQLSRLADIPQLEVLTHLEITHDDLDARHIGCMADTPLLEDLRVLVLGHVEIDALCARTLAGTTQLEALEDLHLWRNPLRDDGVAHIARGNWTQLRRLDLVAVSTGDAGARALATSDQLGSLEQLDLQYNHITDRGAELLADSEHLSNLNALHLEHNAIDQPSSSSPNTT
jgi:hypothetical protein